VPIAGFVHRIAMRTAKYERGCGVTESKVRSFQHIGDYGDKLNRKKQATIDGYK